MKILLWDIDGTLIRSGMAGSRAMNAATQAVFGIPSAFDSVDFAGRTDPWAIDQVCTRHGIAPSNGDLDRFYATYVDRLRIELNNPQARTCAGIRELLEHFHRRADVRQGLLTGNVEAGARAKLEHFGLWHYFAFGAFADDSGDRNALGPFALRRARAHTNRSDLAPQDLIIIGDTPHDIGCARAVGAHCAVAATGRFSVEELSAHRPDLVVPDFGDTRGLIAFVEGLEKSSGVPGL